MGFEWKNKFIETVTAGVAKRETGKERQGITVTRRARGDNASLLAALLSVLRPGRYTLSANLKERWIKIIENSHFYLVRSCSGRAPSSSCRNFPCVRQKRSAARPE